MESEKTFVLFSWQHWREASLALWEYYYERRKTGEEAGSDYHEDISEIIEKFLFGISIPLLIDLSLYERFQIAGCSLLIPAIFHEVILKELALCRMKFREQIPPSQ